MEAELEEVLDGGREGRGGSAGVGAAGRENSEGRRVEGLRRPVRRVER